MLISPIKTTINAAKIWKKMRYLIAISRWSSIAPIKTNIDDANISSIKHDIAEKQNDSFTQEPNANLLSQEMNIDLNLAMKIINACNWFN